MEIDFFGIKFGKDKNKNNEHEIKAKTYKEYHVSEQELLKKLEIKGQITHIERNKENRKVIIKTKEETTQ